MRKLIILTAEPKNFVPVEIQKEAEALGMTAQIIDVTETVLVEGVKSDGSLSSCLYLIKDSVFTEEKTREVVKVELDSETVIIPRLNEHHLEIKLGILKRLQQLGCCLINTPESMELCNDKLMSQVILNTAGIRTPLSFTVQNLDDIETVVTEFEKTGLLKYPVILKTLRGTHGIGVMKLDSRSSLVSVAQTLSKEGLDFLIQEFCKHEQSCRIIMLGNDLLAANLRGQPKEKDEFRTNSHLGSETEKYEPSDEELAVARRIVELFGCKFCAIDYIKLEDGSLIVLEVNGSPGLEAIQKNWPEKNLPQTVAKFALSGCTDINAVPPQPEATSSDSKEQLSVEPSSIPTDAVQEVERCLIHRLINSEVECRVDTGAKTSSLHCDKFEIIKDPLAGDRVKFKRGDITYVVKLARTVLIKNLHGGESTKRPVILLDVTLKGKRFNQVEFTLTDRSLMKYDVLIGRNVLGPLGLPVIVNKTDYSENPAEAEVNVEEE